MANEAAISTLAGQISDCIVFSDAANHALMIRGIRHSGAEYQIFRHNVPRGTERLRLTPTPLHSDEQIDWLVTALAEIWSNSPVDSRRAGRSPASHKGGMDRCR